VVEGMDPIERRVLTMDIATVSQYAMHDEIEAGHLACVDTLLSDLVHFRTDALFVHQLDPRDDAVVESVNRCDGPADPLALAVDKDGESRVGIDLLDRTLICLERSHKVHG